MDWANAMSAITADQQDMHELVSRWKDMLNPTPMDVDFHFFDNTMYSIPNFAKIYCESKNTGNASFLTTGSTFGNNLHYYNTPGNYNSKTAQPKPQYSDFPLIPTPAKNGNGNGGAWLIPVYSLNYLNENTHLYEEIVGETASSVDGRRGFFFCTGYLNTYSEVSNTSLILKGVFDNTKNNINGNGFNKDSVLEEINKNNVQWNFDFTANISGQSSQFNYNSNNINRLFAYWELRDSSPPVSAVAYAVEDIVFYGTAGSYYKCTTAQTAGSPPPIDGDTGQVAEGWISGVSDEYDDNLPTWEILKVADKFNVGEIVIYGDAYYKCLNEETSNTVEPSDEPDNETWQTLKYGEDNTPLTIANAKIGLKKFLIFLHHNTDEPLLGASYSTQSPHATPLATGTSLDVTNISNTLFYVNSGPVGDSNEFNNVAKFLDTVKNDKFGPAEWDGNQCSYLELSTVRTLYDAEIASLFASPFKLEAKNIPVNMGFGTMETPKPWPTT
jgi:hypothetical protein